MPRQLEIDEGSGAVTRYQQVRLLRKVVVYDAALVEPAQQVGGAVEIVLIRRLAHMHRYAVDEVSCKPMLADCQDLRDIIEAFQRQQRSRFPSHQRAGKPAQPPARRTRVAPDYLSRRRRFLPHLAKQVFFQET